MKGGEQIEASMKDINSKSRAFVEQYYSTFDGNREGLANLYRENCVQCVKDEKIQGAQNIVAKLLSLSVKQCKHIITTVAWLPTRSDGGLIVFVRGTLVNLNDGTIVRDGTFVNDGIILDGGKRAFEFSQVCLVISIPMFP